MYKVSVVTPFHNVELGIFENAYQSMKSQTIGFENIQGIVIAHNCEPHYLPALQEMLGKHDNVIVRGLDNDIHTPSSPRNYGMQFATAPYLVFWTQTTVTLFIVLKKPITTSEKPSLTC